jgi:hypothetical protein
MTDFEAAILAFVLETASLGLWIHAAWLWATQRRAPIACRPYRPVPWHLLTALLLIYVAWVLVLQLLSRLAGVAHAVKPQPPGVTLREIQVNCLAQLILFLVIPGLLALTARSTWADFGLPRTTPREALADFGAGVWGLVLCILPVTLAAALVQSRRAEHPHELLKFLQNHPDFAAAAWVTISAVILAPLFEEMVFRVILQATLEKYLRPPWAIVVAALTFAAVHQGYDKVPIFALALILGYVYHCRRSLLATGTLHALFNGSNLLMLLLTGK